MRVWLRRSVGLLAIYLIALTAILSSFSGPQPASAAFDPFSVICHSGPQDASQTDTGPATPASLPNHGCDHCTLCSAAPVAAVAFDGVAVDYRTPTKPLHRLRAVAIVTRDDSAGSPRQAQGPPQLT